MTIELTADELLAQAKAEYEAKAAAILETAARHKAEIAQQAQLLEFEQRRIEREVEKREAQQDLEVYLLAWREKFVEQADQAEQFVKDMAGHLQALRDAGQGQQAIQQRAQASLVDFTVGFRAYIKAFDSEVEMRQAAYDLAEQMTAGINWNLPVTAALRTEFGIRNADWRNQFGDLRRQAIDKGLKAQPAQPAPATIQAAMPESTEPNAPTAPTQPAPQRRQKRR